MKEVKEAKEMKRVKEVKVKSGWTKKTRAFTILLQISKICGMSETCTNC